MAKTCFLCGGPLRDGKCTECGLDNNKNDKKYQLNSHNDSGAHFHSGDCEDQLNKEREPEKQTDKKKKKKEKTAQETESFDYRKMLEEEKKKVHTGSAYKKKKTVKTSAGTGKTSVGGKKKKKRGPFFWLILIYLLLTLLSSIAESGALDDIGDYVEEIIYSLEEKSEDEPSYVGVAEQEVSLVADRAPEQISYQEDSAQYFTSQLEQGIYTVGYEIPAGTYQFQLASDEEDEYATARITWLDQERLGDGIYLYSEDARENYKEFFEKECPYSPFSPEVTLEEGQQFQVENEYSDQLSICGLTEEGALQKEHEPQGKLAEVVLEGDMSQICGGDFAPGVYDLVVEGEYPYSYVSVSAEDRVLNGLYSELGISLSWRNRVCRRIPLEEGNVILAEYLDEGETVRLVPSY